MFKCLRAPECGIWNHLECLEGDLRSHLEVRLEKRSLQGYLDRRAPAYELKQQARQRSLGNTIAVGIANAASTIIHGAMHAIEGNTPDREANSSFDAGEALLRSPRGRAKKGKDSNKNSRLQISISNAGPGADSGNGAVIAKIKVLPGTKGETDVKEWTIKLDCLKCGKPLD
jgi:hypothetical protein